MANQVLYDDATVVLDNDGVTLRRYYFPTGASKSIPYKQIRRFEVRQMDWLTGKGRGWGSAHPQYWLPLDVHRPRKDTLIVLDLGRFVKPAFSPDKPERVVEVLRAHVKASATGT